MSLEKLFSLKMDKFVIRSHGSKPPETAKEPEKCKTKVQKENMITSTHSCSKIAGLAIFIWLQKADSLDILYCHVCRMLPQSGDKTSDLYLGKSSETLLRKVMHV